MARVDWIALKAEYATTSISYRKIAEKHGVSFNTLKDRAVRDRWSAARKEYREKVTKRTVQKVASRQARNTANKLIRLQSSSDKLTAVIDKIFEDADQFQRHIVQTRDGDVWNADERRFDKFDTKAIRDLASSIKDLATTMRNLYDLPTITEKVAMEIAQKKLLLDETKAGVNDDSEETGVVILPEILPKEEDPEQ